MSSAYLMTSQSLDYLEGLGDVLSRLIMGISGVTISVIGSRVYLISLPDPPSSLCLYALSISKRPRAGLKDNP